MTTWINPEGIMLNEVNHTQKDKCHMILLTPGIKKHLLNLDMRLWSLDIGSEVWIQQIKHKFLIKK